jgi:hypothetical protein
VRIALLAADFTGPTANALRLALASRLVRLMWHAGGTADEGK